MSALRIRFLKEVSRAPDLVEREDFLKFAVGGLFKIIPMHTSDAAAAGLLRSKGAREISIPEVIDYSKANQSNINYVAVSDGVKDLVKLGIPSNSIMSTVTITNQLIRKTCIWKAVTSCT